MKKCFFFNLFLHIKISLDYLYHNLENILYKIYSEKIKRRILFICSFFIQNQVFSQKIFIFLFHIYYEEFENRYYI